MKNTEQKPKPKRKRCIAEPPYFGRVATYAFYAAKLGYNWECPRNVRDYVLYKYWCINHGYDAIAGAVQPEQSAFEAYMSYYEEQKALWQDFLDNVLDSESQ